MAISDVLAEQENQVQLVALIGFAIFLTIVRVSSAGRIKALQGEHVLEISQLNNCNLFQQLFTAYLSAAILEPVLAIGGMEEVDGWELVVNLSELGSILWWLWLLTDAFDFEDVMQHYTYHVKFRQEQEENPDRYPWMHLYGPTEDAQAERRTLVGTVRRDIALWFVLAVIGAAWLPGVVTHRDALHAYVIVAMWTVQHHLCRQATTWGTGYFVSFLFPSTALGPLEYCFPLADVSGTTEDMPFVESYRKFVSRRTGVDLILRS